MNSSEIKDNQEVTTAKSEAKWYVLQSTPGQEKKAIQLLKDELVLKSMGHLVEEVFIPSETVNYKRGNENATKNVRYFPGYIMMRMVLTDDLWHLLKGISKISGFIGANQKKPDTVSDKELELVKQKIEQGTKQSEIDSFYQVGETVLIVDGPFMDFKGTVDSIDKAKNKLTVTVSIFGRATPLELEIDKVKPL